MPNSAPHVAPANDVHNSHVRLLARASAIAPRIGERHADRNIETPRPQPYARIPASPGSTYPCKYETRIVISSVEYALLAQSHSAQATISRVLTGRRSLPADVSFTP